MLIRYSQTDCKYEKVINYVLYSTNNYKTHYRQAYKDILLCELEARLIMQANAVKARAQFFDKLVFNQTHNKRFRNLLLE